MSAERLKETHVPQFQYQVQLPMGCLCSTSQEDTDISHSGALASKAIKRGFESHTCHRDSEGLLGGSCTGKEALLVEPQQIKKIACL